MTKQCYYCSYPNSDNATRCINCGMELMKYWDKSSSRPKLVMKEGLNEVMFQDYFNRKITETQTVL